MFYNLFKSKNMKLYLNLAALFLTAFVLSITSCKKNEIELIGTESTAGFSFQQLPASDTLPYPCNVAFSNNSVGAFMYQWNFGDNSTFSAETDPVHEYKAGGTYNVTLTSVGTYGNNSITKVISVRDACENDFFNALTNCSFAEWTWSTDNDAITILYPDGTSVFSIAAAADCQADDIFKFNANGNFNYESNGQTYSNVSSSCVNPLPNATTYKVVSRAGQLPKIILGEMEAGLGTPFLGSTNPVENNLYEVRSYAFNNLVLRATLQNSGGKIIEMKLKKRADLTINDIKDILTGGSSRSWKLDASTGANAIVVGTEGNPSEYYGGGPLEPNCQVDDVYTFSAGNTLNYNANGSTFNGGNIAPNYNCGDDRSFNANFTFGPVTGGYEGLATITLPGAPPLNFIGTTDIPTDNIYRIIEITPTRMLLRAGSGSGTVFQFKFVRQ
jgi:PKD repeat protein